jgi:hypothetical protein
MKRLAPRRAVPLALVSAAACAPGVAGIVNTVASADRSVFEQYAGKRCEVVARSAGGDESLFERDCGLLSNLADGTSEACSPPADAPRPVEARFPGRTQVMFLCEEGGRPQSLAAAARVRFAFLSDFGAGEDERKGTRQVSVAGRLAEVCFGAGVESPCDFIASGGDNIYPDGVPDVFSALFNERFEDPYRDLPPGVPFFLVPGNHDHYGNVQAQVEYSYFSRRWRMPARSYGMPGLPAWLGIHFVDTTPLEDSDAGSSPRVEDARATLCKSKWKLLISHHPVAASGHHGPSRQARDFLDALTTGCPNPIVLSGHEHHQEHVYDGRIHQILQGAGGAIVKPTEPGRYSHAPERGLFHFLSSKHGFAVFDVTSGALSFSFYDLTPAGKPLWSCRMDDPAAAPICE